MPVTVIVGGQFGSEGKGKVAHYFAKEKRAAVAIRVGGSNSGHTVIDSSGEPRIFRVLPTAAILNDIVCVLGAGSYIDVDILLQEVEIAHLPPDRLMIDPNAYIIAEEHKHKEREWDLGKRIGSTQSGTGAAVVERIRRQSTRNLAQNDAKLSPFVEPVRAFLRSQLQLGEHIILEGTQGFGLSALHSPHYPKATSRDTTAATFVGEAGLSPLDVDDVVLVTRAFPIRVAGNSGPLPREIDWETVSREGGWETPLVEHTSVTKRLRRVARFDAAIVQDAILANAPTQIVLNHVDFFDAQSLHEGRIRKKVENEIIRIEETLGRKFDLIGLGPDIIRFRETVFNRLAAA